MSTLIVFQQMTGITKATPLDITTEQEESLVRSVAAKFPNAPSSASYDVTAFTVSTYIHKAKDPAAGLRYVPYKLQTFASHWGIIIGEPEGHKQLYHLVIDVNNEGNERVKFVNRGADELSKDGLVKEVGTCRYSHEARCRIGNAMIEAFGNYHTVFWNCQTFARCYLRVITENNVSSFGSLTASDATSLFLCAFVIPAPAVTTSRIRQRRKEKQLQNVGINVIENAEFAISENASDKEIMEMSFKIIKKMKDILMIEEDKLNFEDIVKDSSDKVGLLRNLWRILTGKTIN